MLKKGKKKKTTAPHLHVSLVSSEPINLPIVLDSNEEDEDESKHAISPESRTLSPIRAKVAHSDDQASQHSTIKQTKQKEEEKSSESFNFYENCGFTMPKRSVTADAAVNAVPTGETNPEVGKMVKLNIGGTLFCTSLATLHSQSGMLSAMFSGRYSPFKDQNDYYFIDRDGTHFRYILNYLRDGYVRLPDDLQKLQELMIEAQYYQIHGLVKAISEAPRLGNKEYITIRYLPANTYDGWPIRIEGPLEDHIICELNGGSMPPYRETTEVRNMYGQASTGWKMRGIFLTKIFNIISSHGWVLSTSNGSGGGKQRNFAEMYVFCRSKMLRKKRPKGSRRSALYSYSHLFPSPYNQQHNDYFDYSSFLNARGSATGQSSSASVDSQLPVDRFKEIHLADPTYSVPPPHHHHPATTSTHSHHENSDKVEHSDVA